MARPRRRPTVTAAAIALARSAGASWKHLERRFGVSARTLQRRLREKDATKPVLSRRHGCDHAQRTILI